jgi:glycosyltransferase involved in cell wall biosynthesis
MNQVRDWPIVTVVICTFDRPHEIRQTIASLFNNLQYPQDRLRWHIADDGSPNGYVDDVRSFIESSIEFLTRYSADDRVTHTVTQRKGWGANVNAALRAVQSDYVYFTEDDYLLLRPLDLRPHVALMETHKNVGLVRYGIAGHGMWTAVREADISAWLPEFQENTSNQGYTGAGKLSYLEIHPRMIAGEYGFYRYSNRPHLKHRRFHEHFGPYPEGLSLGRTEEAMNHLIGLHAKDSPALVCPADWVLWHFDHIGVSYQGSAAESEAMRHEA